MFKTYLESSDIQLLEQIYWICAIIMSDSAEESPCLADLDLVSSIYWVLKRAFEQKETLDADVVSSITFCLSMISRHMKDDKKLATIIRLASYISSIAESA